jgi:hypothetical protein
VHEPEPEPGPEPEPELGLGLELEQLAHVLAAGLLDVLCVLLERP